MRFQAICLFKMHQFLAILHIMINNNYIQDLIVVKVLKKNLLALKWAIQGQKGAKMRFQAFILANMHQFLVILHIMIENNNIQYLMLVQVLKKIFLALELTIYSQKGVKMLQAIFSVNMHYFCWFCIHAFFYISTTTISTASLRFGQKLSTT